MTRQVAGGAGQEIKVMALAASAYCWSEHQQGEKLGGPSVYLC